MNDRTILRDQESEAKCALLSRPFLSRQFRKGGLAFSPHIRQTSSPRRSMIRGRSWPRLGVRNMRASLSGLPMNTISSSENFIWMAGICLDRLLKQRCALPDFSFDPPLPHGGLRALPFTVARSSAGFQPASAKEAGRDACATKIRILGAPLRSLSVGPACLATKFRALSGLLF